MDIAVLTVIMFAMFFLGLALGIPIGLTLGTVGILGLWMAMGSFTRVVPQLENSFFAMTGEFAFLVVPFFVLMGLLAVAAGIGDAAFDAAYALLRRLPGGLGIASMVGAAAFSTVTGTSISVAAVFSKVAIPQMIKHGYDKRFATGIVAAGGSLDLIAPSTLLVLFGILTDTSVGDLFLAALVPTVILMFAFIVQIYLQVKLKPSMAGGNLRPPRATRREITASLRKTWSVVILAGLVLGGIYGGFFNAIEAGAVGAFGALIIALIMRTLTRQSLWSALLETGQTTAMIFFILIGANLFSRFLAVSGITNAFVDWVAGSGMPSWGVIGMVILLYLFLGCFIDSLSIMVISLPLVFPLVVSLGFNPVWFGVVSALSIEVGLITPPFGTNVYVTHVACEKIAGVSLVDVFRGVMPFIVTEVVAIIIVASFPILSTWIL